MLGIPMRPLIPATEPTMHRLQTAFTPAIKIANLAARLFVSAPTPSVFYASTSLVQRDSDLECGSQWMFRHDGSTVP